MNIESHKVLFGKNLPFVPLFNCFIYIEPTGYDEHINNFIKNHLDSIVDSFGRNQTFFYLPAIVDKSDSIIQYNRPGFGAEWFGKKGVTMQDLYDEIASCCIEGREYIDGPSLIRYDGGANAGYRFTVFPLRLENDAQPTLFQFDALSDEEMTLLFEAIKKDPSGVYSSTLVDDMGSVNIRSSTIIEGVPMASAADRGRIDILAEEIRDRIEQLKLMGVSDFVIRRMIALPEPKLSRLLITQDYRIVLPDYNDMEITMPTLSKVIYFFYLRHPEGLRFKDLVDYRSELLRIYCVLSNREDMTKLEQSIDELVDSSRNSINEKCSRIRAAFVSRFSDDLAKNYFVTYGSDYLKVVTLDRSLVIDESGITKNK